LQRERAAAFSEFVADVDRKAFPEAKHLVHMDPAELKRFLQSLEHL
jgi:3-methyl-2-oxobutanoate hydroxymethyltransferase